MLILFLCLSAWAGDEKPITTLQEVARLETIRGKRALFSDERADLAYLYLLRGDCQSVRFLYGDNRDPVAPLDETDRDLLCACDGKCDLLKLNSGSRQQQKLHVFRQLLSAGTSLSDEMVQKLWQELAGQPEAKYLMFKRLKNSKSSTDKVRAIALQKQLAALNVEH